METKKWPKAADSSLLVPTNIIGFYEFFFLGQK